MAAKKVRSKIIHKTPATPPKPSPVTLNTRGVANWKEAAEWLRARGIEDIECITPDLAGVPRGKDDAVLEVYLQHVSGSAVGDLSPHNLR
jgi:glutamine synthetase